MANLSGGYVGSVHHSIAMEAEGYKRGRFQAEREAEREYREYDEVIQRWKAHSAQLEQRVAELEQAFAKERASYTNLKQLYGGAVATLRATVPVMQQLKVLPAADKARFDLGGALRSRYEAEIQELMANGYLKQRPEHSSSFKDNLPVTYQFITDTILKN